jgi:ligand-binding sensor domain-containing protein
MNRVLNTVSQLPRLLQEELLGTIQRTMQWVGQGPVVAIQPTRNDNGGHILALTAGGTITLLRFDTFYPIFTHQLERTIKWGQFTADEQAITLLTQEGQFIRFEPQTQEVSDIASVEGTITALLQSAGRLWLGTEEGRIYRVESNEVSFEVFAESPGVSVTCLCTTPDGAWLGAGRADGQVVLYRQEDGVEIATLENNSPVKAIEASDSYLAVGLESTHIKLWNLRFAERTID